MHQLAPWGHPGGNEVLQFRAFVGGQVDGIVLVHAPTASSPPLYRQFTRHRLLDLVTTEGIARWFERQAGEDLISVRETTVGDVLAEQPRGSFLLMARDATVFDAENAFAQLPNRDVSRLYAIIVTQNGKRTEKPLGIVTPWELLDHVDGSLRWESR